MSQVLLKKYDQACTQCEWQAEIRVPAGVHPRCPECGSRTERIFRGGYGFVGDEIPGGLVVENLGDQPVKVYSKSELKFEAEKRGLDHNVKHIGVPGSDKSPHTTRWT